MAARWIAALLVVGPISLAPVAAGAAFVDEDFSSDPVAGGRFSQQTAGTESSFTHNPGAENLTVVLDVDSALATYSSNPVATPFTDVSDLAWQMDFRIEDLDNNASLPVFFFGMNDGGGMDSGGEGLSMALSISGFTPELYARIDSFTLNASGADIILLELIDYRAFAAYSATTRTFTVQVFSGLDFDTLVGTSSLSLGVGEVFAVDRLGFQNAERLLDQTDGSVTLTVDNISAVPEPASAALLALGLVGLGAHRRATHPPSGSSSSSA